MPRIPHRFPTDLESWYYDKELADCTYEIQNFYAGYNRRLTTVSSSSNLNTTLANPVTELLFFMLHLECFNKTNQRVTIRYGSERLEDPYLPATGPQPIYPNDEQKCSLRIHHIKYGGPKIPNLDKACELKAVSMSLQRSNQHKVRVFKRNENTVDVYTNVWSWEIYYKLVALLPMFFPHAYPEPSELVIQSLVAVADKDQPKFQRIVTEWYRLHDPEKERMLSQLRQFFSGRTERQMTAARTEIQRIRKNIEDNYAAITELYRILDNYNRNLYALETAPAGDMEHIEDLVSYIGKNKSIHSYSLNGEQLRLVVETPIKYVDVDAMKRCYIDKPYFNEVTTNLIKETFIDEKYDIMVFSVMNLNLDGAVVERGQPASNMNSIPHPHIMDHNCWGNNKSHIKEALVAQDLMTAIAQCIATNMNLNAVDSIVVRGLFSHLAGDRDNRTCIKDLTTNELISYNTYRQRYFDKRKENDNASNQNND